MIGMYISLYMRDYTRFPYTSERDEILHESLITPEDIQTIAIFQQ